MSELTLCWIATRLVVSRRSTFVFTTVILSVKNAQHGSTTTTSAAAIHARCDFFMTLGLQAKVQNPITFSK
ncbi:hypothetical protein DFH05DRAFT_1517495 [Lentinula detonsa]|uniref:Uncharacterized protein n=1 Tax=Lentinula detonsa TaxID=2804962 RepID=A0A9W8NPP0_9AGAR|nr:hypothetical protein DFH05DRAFT_1517846 [Lentinula detonsa]KAJ3738387.1 hypothetical protein DFH05DRAFT_1517678 [Lentinula detonsa]KAJ3738392.1 hypothetical protein DFH05DRAFT_1517630 [Lentinula detonsa]KAJ3738399.1 hypothetical protein DFH05DRAFT_1517575 [Lentinula detonsa]KAJ3738431.1 hypothetical protein DFH05DRAFT_1517495 [Lentinula detonsa]